MSSNFSSESLSSLQRVVIFAIVSAYCLHLLRNVHGLFSISPILFAGLGVVLLLKTRLSANRNGLFILGVFVFFNLLSCFYSYLWYPEESYVSALARYFYMYPFLVFLILSNLSFLAFIYILRLFSFFVLFGGVSIFYQILFGPVSWFPDHSEREGLVRFSSLVGSLTSYGIVGGLALPVVLLAFKQTVIRMFFIGSIILAMLFTLQKAAVVNIILFLLYVCFFLSFKHKALVLLLGAATSFALLYVSYELEVGYVVATVDNVFRIREGAGISDVGFVEGVIDRLWALPSVLYDLHGFYGMLFGVGLAGGSGALGMLDYPMAHNGFIELLFIGGLFNLLSFVLVLLFSVHRLVHAHSVFQGQWGEGVRLVKCLIFFYFLLIVNMLFSGVIYFHPYSGLLFYVVTVFVLISLPRIVDGWGKSQYRGRYV